MAKKKQHGEFLVIECSASEMYTAVGSPGICDMCGCYPARGYYVAALNQWICESCFNEFISNAVFYPEDADVQRRNFDFYSHRFGIKCQ